MDKVQMLEVSLCHGHVAQTTLPSLPSHLLKLTLAACSLYLCSNVNLFP